jgi:hypothetical protein
MKDNEPTPPQLPHIGMTSGERLSVRSTTIPERSMSQPSGFRACPHCAGPIHFTRCMWCGSRFHRTCSKCGDIGCASVECGATFRRRMTNAFLAGVGAAVLIWFGIKSFVPNPWEPPASTLRRHLARASAVWHPGVSYAAYIERAAKPGQLVADDRYGPVLAGLTSALGPNSKEPATIRNSGLVAEDLFTLVYGASLPESGVNLLSVVKACPPVEPDAVPRQGDVAIFEQSSAIYWAIMTGPGSTALYYSPGQERLTVIRISDDFWKKSLIAVLRPQPSTP